MKKRGEHSPYVVADKEGVRWRVRHGVRREAVLSISGEHEIGWPLYLFFASEFGALRRSRHPILASQSFSEDELREMLANAVALKAS